MVSKKLFLQLFQEFLVRSIHWLIITGTREYIRNTETREYIRNTESLLIVLNSYI